MGGGETRSKNKTLLLCIESCKGGGRWNGMIHLSREKREKGKTELKIPKS